MLLLLLRVGAEEGEGEDMSDEEKGYCGQTVAMHNLKLNYKNYNVLEEDPLSVVIIENITAHKAYSGRDCRTLQYYCNKTGMMSTKFQDDAIPGYWNDSRFYVTNGTEFLKNTSHQKFVMEGDHVGSETIRVFIILNCSYKPEMCPNDLYILHKISYKQRDAKPGEEASEAPEEVLEVVGPQSVEHTFRLLAGNKVLTMGVTVEDELFRI